MYCYLIGTKIWEIIKIGGERLENVQSGIEDIKFCVIEPAIFKHNLVLIDSGLPTIIDNLLFAMHQTGIKECRKLIWLLQESNPLMYEDNCMYEYKLKKFLCLCVLGVDPTKKWARIDEAAGGHILVALENEILEFNISNRFSFEQNLLDITTFERDNSGSTIIIFDEKSEECVRIGLKL